MNQISASFIFLTLSFSILSAQSYDDSFKKGMANLFNGNYINSIDHFHLALKDKPEDASAHYQIARAFAKNEKIDSVLFNLYSAIDKDSHQVIRYSYLLQDTFFMLLHNRDEWKKVISYFEEKRGGKNLALFRELIKIRIKDQDYRQQLYGLFKEGKENTQEYHALEGLMKETDSLNLVRILEIIDIHGYPGKELVGDANSVAWLVIQHSSAEIQKKYFGDLEKAAEKGDITKGALAMTIDRIRLSEGKDQLYGTQYTRNQETGKLEFFPIESKEEVNQRRAEMDMRSIEEYAKRRGIKWE